jgi:tRNA(fMet)-specific endonuclease VapC
MPRRRAVPRYLLDTNMISDLIRRPAGRVAQRIAELGERRVCTSIIVAAELRYGAVKRRASQLTRLVEGVLERLEVLPLEPPADAAYAQLRTELEQRGRVIGGNDLLIAAHAIASGHTLVTANAREFSRIAELACENWLAA